jgi:hypothetical protein
MLGVIKMIQVFCSKRGSGKSKKLIEMANEHSSSTSGHVVFLDDDNGPMYSLERSIRFVSTKEYKLKSLESLCGFLCGILSGDYDISEVYIDGLANIVNVNTEKDQEAFAILEELCSKFNIDIYMSVNEEAYNPVPDYVKKYIAEAK